MEFVNLTPYLIRVLNIDDSEALLLNPSGEFAWVNTQKRWLVGLGGNVPLLEDDVEAGSRLPNPQPGVLYVGTEEVAEYAASRGRQDVFYPGGVVVKKGKILVCRYLARYKPFFSKQYLSEVAQRLGDSPVDFGIWLMKQIGYKAHSEHFGHNSLHIDVVTPSGEQKTFSYGDGANLHDKQV